MSLVIDTRRVHNATTNHRYEAQFLEGYLKVKSKLYPLGCTAPKHPPCTCARARAKKPRGGESTERRRHIRKEHERKGDHEETRHRVLARVPSEY